MCFSTGVPEALSGNPPGYTILPYLGSTHSGSFNLVFYIYKETCSRQKNEFVEIRL